MKLKKNKKIENFDIKYKKIGKNLIMQGQSKMGLNKEILNLNNKVVILNNQLFCKTHQISRNILGKFKLLIKSIISGFFVELKIVGLGYSIYKVDNKIIFDLGYSHFLSYKIPDEILLKIDGSEIYLYSINKEKVKNIAAMFKKLKKLNIYTGTGIVYKREKLKLKEGKVR